MDSEGITRILTSDHHFEQEGFTVLMTHDAIGTVRGVEGGELGFDVRMQCQGRRHCVPVGRRKSEAVSEVSRSGGDSQLDPYPEISIIG